jgi:hypothetical protein
VDYGKSKVMPPAQTFDGAGHNCKLFRARSLLLAAPSAVSPRGSFRTHGDCTMLSGKAWAAIQEIRTNPRSGGASFREILLHFGLAG